MQATATTTDQHIAALNVFTSRQGAGFYLVAVKGAALKALARELNVPAGTREAMVDGIVERTVGKRLNSAAIRAL